MSVLNNSLLLGAPAASGGVSRSLRFNSADSAYLSRTPASAGSQTTWTFSCWIKRSVLGSRQTFGISASTGNGVAGLEFADNDTLDCFITNNGSSWTGFLQTTQVFRDPSAWYHIVFTVDTNNGTASDRLRLYVNGSRVTTFNTANYPNSGTATGINGAIAHAIGSRAGGTYYTNGYLADIYFIDGQALDPTSFGEFDATTGVWNPKAYSGSYGTNGYHLDFADNSSAAALGYDAAGSNDWTVNNLLASFASVTVSTPIGQLNTSILNGTDTKTYWRTKITMTGISVPSGAQFGYRGIVENGNPTPSHTITKNGVAIGSFAGTIGNSNWLASSNYANNQGVISQAILPSDTVEITTNVAAWHGADRIIINGVPIVIREGDVDSLVDSPINGLASAGADPGGVTVGNYATLNPLAKHPNTTLSNGNLDVSSTGVYTTLSTIAFPNTGKYYAEFTIRGTASGYPFVGIGGFNDAGINAYGNPNTGAFYTQGGSVTGSVSASGLGSLSTGDVVGVAYDCATGKVWFSRNGTYVLSGNPAAGTNQTATLSANSSGLAFATSTYTGGDVTFNAGQRPFKTAAPAGFSGLCTANLPAPTIVKPDTVFDVKLYTGTGSTQSITGLGFSPDLVWIKNRGAAASNHVYDVQRGTLRLATDATNAEFDNSDFSTFDSAGFTVTGSKAQTNQSSNSYVAWTWDAGSSTVTNTAGSITSSVRANATAGFSIVTYTGNGTGGATFGHGCGTAPELLIFKTRGVADDWRVYHKQLDASAPANYYLMLQSTNGKSGNQGTSFMNSTNPSSTLITLGSDSAINGNGRTMVCYAFSPVVGYSSMGSYVGNGSSTDGPFVFTGMRPRWILTKCSSSSLSGNADWYLIDTARDTYNVSSKILFPHSSSAEGTLGIIDVLSNGFKIRSSGQAINQSSETYIYIAFAESPLNYSRAR